MAAFPSERSLETKITDIANCVYHNMFLNKSVVISIRKIWGREKKFEKTIADCVVDLELKIFVIALIASI